jgi:hypothetical protein
VLGLGADHDAVARGAQWLLDRPQSAHNPGRWFGADELVEAQAQVVAQRAAGKGGRFREIKASEQNRVRAGDDMIRMPCGPRIMWPNALVMEALLALGYEGHDRVQTALRTMSVPQDWCECGYQHGTSGWRETEPLSQEALERFEQRCVNQYRYGGMGDTQALFQADLAHQSNQVRMAREATGEGDTYHLRMSDHVQGCEFITTRALSQVRDERARRYAEAHLWRFAGLQCGPDGAFPAERYGTGFDLIGILEAISRYEHPASRVVVMRALPWIVEAQNEDGSWGEGADADASTLAALRALLSLGDDLPAGMRP